MQYSKLEACHFNDNHCSRKQNVFVWYTKGMQKIATRIFIYASITFGFIGILGVLTASGPDKPDSSLSQIFIRLLFINVFIILPSLALSIAGKYLSVKS
jgi:hypothetical protein